VSQRRREESRADEQRHRQRNLCDEQAAPERSQRPDHSAAGTQSFVDAYGDGLPRGHDANREADTHGEQRRRDDDAGIRRHRRKPRRSARADQRCGHDANDSPRERKRTRERHRRQHKPVDQHLPAHAPPASSQCEADRDLVASRQRARQDQARKVGARDRQEDPHQRQKHPERGAVAVAQAEKPDASGATFSR
jgi:hypothetical protein